MSTPITGHNPGKTVTTSKTADEGPHVIPTGAYRPRSPDQRVATQLDCKHIRKSEIPWPRRGGGAVGVAKPGGPGRLGKSWLEGSEECCIFEVVG